MALITCPACGKMISENASSCPNCGEPIAAKQSAIVDSGTESFTVNAATQIGLTAEVEAKIRAITARLSTEGKTVVNITKSAPMSGIALLSMDVTIIWNANLGSEKYKEYLYKEAKSLYSLKQYARALEQFKKLGNYSDSKSMVSQCINGLSEIYREQAKERQMESAIGVDPRTNKNRIYWLTGGWITFGLGIILIIGAFANDIEYNGLSAIWGLIIGAIGLAILIYQSYQQTSYDKKHEEYIKKSTNNRTVPKEPSSVKEDEDKGNKATEGTYTQINDKSIRCGNCGMVQQAGRRVCFGCGIRFTGPR